MIKINQDIFDEILRYEEGAMGDEDKAEMVKKIQSDDIYRQHYEYYNTVIKAISKAAEEEDQTSLEKPATVDSSPEENAYYDELLKNDKRRIIRQRIIRWGILSFFSLGFLLIGRFFFPNNPTTAPLLPVAQNESEQEEPMTSAGNAETIIILFQQIEQTNKPILMEEYEGNNIEYLLQSNSLQLYAPENSALKERKMKWIPIKRNDIMEHFLQIDEDFYKMIPDNTRRPLEVVQESEVLNLLQ